MSDSRTAVGRLAGRDIVGRGGVIGFSVMLAAGLTIMFYNAFPVPWNAILVVAGLYSFIGGWALLIKDACRPRPVSGLSEGEASER